MKVKKVVAITSALVQWCCLSAQFSAARQRPALQPRAGGLGQVVSKKEWATVEAVPSLAFAAYSPCGIHHLWPSSGP